MAWYDDLDAYVALPRTNALALSPDGARLVASVSTLDAKKTAWVTSLWAVDPGGARPATRLTRGARGENAVAFTPAGDLLFLAKRPGAPDDDEDAPAALWLLPAEGGEARVVATHPGGFGAIRVEGATLVAAATVLPGATTLESDAALRKARKEAKVSAILHASYPIRSWDHDLGPGQVRLYAGDLTELAFAEAGQEEPRLTLRDLTPDAGAALAGAEFSLAPDGSFVVAGWRRLAARAGMHHDLVRIDVATGERRVLHAEEGFTFEGAVVGPDSAQVAYVRANEPTPDRVWNAEVWVSDADGSGARRIAADWDRWASELRWLPDGSALVAVADENGRAPLFRLPLSGAVERLTDEGAFSSVAVAPEGTVYALRASYEYPNEPVRVAADGAVRALPAVTRRPEIPGRLTEVEATAADGVRLRGWLCLPAGASADAPAPLVLWVHGGPLSSWNAWSWRWCPWLLVAQGYAVLLPDPALSTGYGVDFVQRGWGRWGAEPFTDVMAVTDAVESRADVDASRTAMMGGSFGGYMANWIAGHTDRFRAIVTHASLWALDQFGPTTDAAQYWAKEMSPAMMAEHSPHRFVGEIRTPMLVVHGDKDYRVPIGEGLRLWWELLTASGLPMDADGQTVHRFLYFPDENHWVLSPGHAKVWYEVVQGFLAEHVLGRPATRHPEVLGLTVAEPAEEGTPAAEGGVAGQEPDAGGAR